MTAMIVCVCQRVSDRDIALHERCRAKPITTGRGSKRGLPLLHCTDAMPKAKLHWAHDLLTIAVVGVISGLVFWLVPPVESAKTAAAVEEPRPFERMAQATTVSAFTGSPSR